jgi:hypothetical protein
LRAFTKRENAFLTLIQGKYRFFNFYFVLKNMTPNATGEIFFENCLLYVENVQKMMNFWFKNDKLRVFLLKNGKIWIILVKNFS